MIKVEWLAAGVLLSETYDRSIVKYAGVEFANFVQPTGSKEAQTSKKQDNFDQIHADNIVDWVSHSPRQIYFFL